MPNCKPPALTNDFYLTHEVVRGLFELYMASVVPTGLQSSRMRRSLKGYAFAEQAISENPVCVCLFASVHFRLTGEGSL